jgi:hypothetical protein
MIGLGDTRKIFISWVWRCSIAVLLHVTNCTFTDLLASWISWQGEEAKGIVLRSKARSRETQESGSNIQNGDQVAGGWDAQQLMLVLELSDLIEDGGHQFTMTCSTGRYRWPTTQRGTPLFQISWDSVLVWLCNAWIKNDFTWPKL